MIGRMAAIIAVLVVAVLLYAATRPDQLHIERTIRIAAAPETIFALLDDFHRWPLWAPQDRQDPTMRRTYSGADSGLGAVCAWQGRGSTGQGRMEIIAAAPPHTLTVQVDFATPFTAHNINQFTLAADGAATEVTWRMHGTNPFIAKLMSIFLNMDRMMGKHFDTGLTNLKTAAEAPAAAH